MDEAILKKYISLTKNLGQLLSVARLYNATHPVFKEKAKEVFAEIGPLMEGKQSLILSEVEGMFLINGEKIELKNSLVASLAERIRNLKLGSLDLEPGLTLEELELLIGFLNLKTHALGEEHIREYFKEKGAPHVIPRFATYRLVGEDEKIVKEGETLKIDDIPKEIISRFAEDLKKGRVGEQLEKKEKEYGVLAHDSTFLSGLMSDLTKDAGSKEEVGKILWLVGDYLIDEISTAKEKELNYKVLEDLQKQLLVFWEQKKDRVTGKEDIEKTFVAIGAALELKGLLLLYKKHKKELEGVAKKLSAILETLPPESLIHKKTKEKLEKIGPPSLGAALFGP
ncbi:MAG: hypothetical protein WC133_05970 [Candidatus Omnitrophota bacterium]